MPDPQTLNPVILDRLRHEMADSGIDIISELVAMYSTDAPEMVENMRRASVANQTDQVTREAHGLKGSSANLGAEILSQRCHALETLTRNGTLDGANEHIDAIDAELKRVIAALELLPEITDRGRDQA